MYFYVKALHIIFVVTWFAGLFYMPRLLIYNAEAQSKPEIEKKALSQTFSVMMKRLWYGITWPSALLTLVFGVWILVYGNWYRQLFQPGGTWLLAKLFFVVLLYGYHFSLQWLMNCQLKGDFKVGSQKLRIWNELATVLLFALVFLATVKEILSFVWAIVGLLLLMAVLLTAIYIYKKMRQGMK